MSILDSILVIMTNDVFKSTIGTITGLSGIFGAIYATYRFIKRLLNNPIKDKSELLEKSGAPIWIVRLFSINIPLNTIPLNTRTDKLLSGGFSIFLLCCMAYLIGMVIPIMKTPEQSTALVYKPSGKIFYLNQEVATGFSILSTHRWAIKKEDCVNLPLKTISHQKGLSFEMAGFICKLFSLKEAPSYIAKSVERFEKDKQLLYFSIGSIEIILMWLCLSLLLTLYFKKKVRKYILKDHKNIKNYIT